MLEKSIEYVKGVGPQKADLLKKELGIFTLEQLLMNYPFRYIDRSVFHKIGELEANETPVQIRGILRRIDSHGEGTKKRMVGIFRDDTGQIELVWFRGLNWVKQLQTGIEYVIYGKVQQFGRNLSITHPELEPLTAKNSSLEPRMDAVYRVTEKMASKRIKSKDLHKIIRNALIPIYKEPEHLPETLPQYLLDSMKLPSRLEALIGIHFPKTLAQKDQARRRFIFEELFFLQLRILQRKSLKQLETKGHLFPHIGGFFNGFYQNNLKFELTGAQKRVLREIRKDLGSGQQMNRLLQGDVGSGKTVVGFMSMLMALDNDFQATLMAPTEILAQQHVESLLKMAEGLDIRIELLTGSIKGVQRRELLEDLAEGRIHILIGTHALIEDAVVFKNLGLVIIDEQHRFGVMQRAKMWKKNAAGPPHILVMTATPIPRTLAMTVYGDLEVSAIDEMPPGRLPIQTSHKFESSRLWVFGQIKEQIAKGHQVYIVYPLIEESESEALAEIKNLMEGYESILREFPQPQYQISVVHGRQKAEDKDYEMQRFAKGETQILMATTVIEVGVNVPNATLMVIENAERFGLAQLHQLRGRVGRGGGEAYCILMTGYKLSKEGRFRMKTMCKTTDGFEIAEADLKLRGPGSIDGTQQSGILNLRLADLAKDGRILQTARNLAKEIVAQDPLFEKPENLPLKRELLHAQKQRTFSKIS